MEAEVPEVDEDIGGVLRDTKGFRVLLVPYCEGTVSPQPGRCVFVSLTRMPFLQCTTLLHQNLTQRGHHNQSATQACGPLPRQN